MTVKLGIVMNPLEEIRYYKDSTVAMMLAAQQAGWELYFLPAHGLKVVDGEPLGLAYHLSVFDNVKLWYKVRGTHDMALANLDIILMRLDPPFNIEYVYITHILDLAEQRKVVVANKPQSLRDANEKLFTTNFPQCCPPTIVSSNMQELHQFSLQHETVVFKPLHGMGGTAVFVIKRGDLNLHVVLETLTEHGSKFIMAQVYIPQITSSGDKRVLLINGQPIPYALARIPAKDDNRGNLAAGGSGTVVELTERDVWICQQLSSTLQQKGLWFVGIDIIGEYLTEINVTSPTCIREISKATNIDIAGQFIKFLSTQLAAKK